MSTFGRTSILTVGRSVRLSADGMPECKAGGVTVDWSLFAAVSGADVTLADGVLVAIGEKYIRYGQVLCKVTQTEVQTVDLSGDDDPTGGTWDMTILGVTIAGIAYNVSAATLQSTIRAALAAVPYGDQVTVGKSGFVYTVTFPADLGNVAAITADATDLTGGVGDTFAITITTTTGGTSTGDKYGPYDDTATDGRATLTRGACYLCDVTVKETDLKSDHPPVIEGGLVWRDRLIATAGTHGLAAGPTYTELEAAFPRLRYVAESPH